MNKTIHTIYNNQEFFIRQEKQNLDLNVYNEVIVGDCYLMSLIQNVYCPAVIVDIGAHIGTFSVLARKMWPDASIIAVEPEPENVELLTANLCKYNNMQIVDGAVVYTEGKVLYIGKTATGGNYMYDQAAKYNQELYYKADYMVKSFKLREITPQVDCLKMDCEGGEYEILEHETPALLTQLKITLGEYHGGLLRFKTAIEQAMPQMRMFYTGPGSSVPNTDSRIGNFWGFSKEIALSKTVLAKLNKYCF